MRYPDWESLELAADGSRGLPAAFCADLSPASVLGAYRRGIVPMPAPDEHFRAINEFRYEDLVADGTIGVVGSGDPYTVAWWSPEPRPVIGVDGGAVAGGGGVGPDGAGAGAGLAAGGVGLDGAGVGLDGAGGVHLGRNVRRVLRRHEVRTTADRAFVRVAEACRAGREPRWLTDPLLAGLTVLHADGWAHSIEVWLGGELIGGAIGVGIGSVISGDSLFGGHPGAAAIAVADMAARLAAAGGRLVDAQWDSPFLRSLGASPMPRERYLEVLGSSAERVVLPGLELPARRLLPPSLPSPSPLLLPPPPPLLG